MTNLYYSSGNNTEVRCIRVWGLDDLLLDKMPLWYQESKNKKISSTITNMNFDSWYIYWFKDHVENNSDLLKLLDLYKYTIEEHEGALIYYFLPKLNSIAELSVCDWGQEDNSLQIISLGGENDFQYLKLIRPILTIKLD